MDQTLNKGSWEHIQQITTVTTTFVKATFVHISNISISKLNTFDFSLVNTSIPIFSFLGGIEVAEIYLPGWVGWVGLTLIIRLSLSSNWTELDWTGTELGNNMLHVPHIHYVY